MAVATSPGACTDHDRGKDVVTSCELSALTIEGVDSVSKAESSPPVEPESHGIASRGVMGAPPPPFRAHLLLYRTKRQRRPGRQEPARKTVSRRAVLKSRPIRPQDRLIFIQSAHQAQNRRKWHRRPFRPVATRRTRIRKAAPNGRRALLRNIRLLPRRLGGRRKIDRC